MGQQQFGVSLSVGTKLLLGVGLLLFVVILFLNVSTILILRDDKRAYTYQSQSNEAILAGREFAAAAKQALDTLRASLVTVDPRSPLGPAQSAALKTLIDNQPQLLFESISYVNPQTGAITPYAQMGRESAMKELELTPELLEISPDQMLQVLPSLTQNSYALLNPSHPGGIPILAVLFADVNLSNLPQGMPVAIGVVSLKGFGSDLIGAQMTITNQDGWVLFDLDPATMFSGKRLSDDPIVKAAMASQVTAGAKEYDVEDGHYLGSYVRPGLNLIVVTRTPWRKAMRATYTLIEKFVLLGSMAIGVAILFGIFFSKTLTAPIGRLYQATKEVAMGNFNIDLKEESGDEIGALTGSFNVMSRKISELIEESMKKVQLENELAIASTVQQTLIPPPSFKSKYVQIQSHYQSASECGGDWWGFFGVGNKLSVMIADATGHGLPSALMTASARSCFSVMAKLAQEDPDFTFAPSAMLSYANRVIYDASLGKIMMTFFIGVLDFEQKTLTYASAGHNPPWLFKNSGGAYNLKSLTAVGQRLGEAREAPEFEQKTVELGERDILFLYTDGLTEGRDQAGEMYGKKRARKLVEASLPGGPELVIRNLVNDFLKHNDGKALDDDLTVAAAMVLAPQGS